MFVKSNNTAPNTASEVAALQNNAAAVARLAAAVQAEPGTCHSSATWRPLRTALTWLQSVQSASPVKLILVYSAVLAISCSTPNELQQTSVRSAASIGCNCHEQEPTLLAGYERWSCFEGHCTSLIVALGQECLLLLGQGQECICAVCSQGSSPQIVWSGLLPSLVACAR
jgi:hypothetical protein